MGARLAASRIVGLGKSCPKSDVGGVGVETTSVTCGGGRARLPDEQHTLLSSCTGGLGSRGTRRAAPHALFVRPPWPLRDTHGRMARALLASGPSSLQPGGWTASGGGDEHGSCLAPPSAQRRSSTPSQRTPSEWTSSSCFGVARSAGPACGRPHSSTVWPVPDAATLG